MNYPSIFNDVIGPVMRGPSSSHCAASNRIGLIAKDLIGGKIDNVMIEYDENGSLATTHETQGVDIGLFAGFLGWDITDERLLNSRSALVQAGIDHQIKIHDFKATHPNTYRITLTNEKASVSLDALSTGGGIIKITAINQIPVNIYGDCYEMLLFSVSPQEKVVQYIREEFPECSILVHQSQNLILTEVKSIKAFEFENESKLIQYFDTLTIRQIKPVLPILSSPDIKVPFESVVSGLAFAENQQLNPWELAVAYESARGNISTKTVIEKMGRLVAIIKKSIEQGLAGTSYSDRLLGYQCGQFQEKMKTGQLIECGVINQMILYITALMEVKSAFGIIVAAPTAGSCGALPGSVIAAQDFFGYSDEETIRAMLVAGLIGVFIAKDSTFAAELAGCQAECGAASGMAAAAFTYLNGGSVKQCFDAASLALQNVFGMTCDPVANRVEVPCLGKNILAGTNALTATNMILAGYDAVIPLQETIMAFDQVGRSLPRSLRCTGLGGLTITETSKKLETALADKHKKDHVS
jgi:L-serine dehydratase